MTKRPAYMIYPSIKKSREVPEAKISTRQYVLTKLAKMLDNSIDLLMKISFKN